MNIKDLCRSGSFTSKVKDSSEKVSISDIDSLESFHSWADSLTIDDVGCTFKGNEAIFKWSAIKNYSAIFSFNEKTKQIKVTILRRKKFFRKNCFLLRKKQKNLLNSSIIILR